MKKANVGPVIMVLLGFVTLAFVTDCGKTNDNLSFQDGVPGGLHG